MKSKPVNKKEIAEDLYSSALTLSQTFEKCGHTKTFDSGIITYSSAEELTQRFPGYEITSGESENIVLSAKVDNFCPDHYKAALTENEITITRLSDNEEVTSVTVASNSLSIEEKSLLEQGITLDSQKALSSFIEDFTS